MPRTAQKHLAQEEIFRLTSGDSVWLMTSSRQPLYFLHSIAVLCRRCCAASIFAVGWWVGVRHVPVGEAVTCQCVSQAPLHAVHA